MVFSAACLFVSHLLLAAPTPQFKSAVNAQVAAARKVAPEIGVVVTDLQSGEVVYSYNPDTPRILASNTKLLTSAAALDLLGPGFAFETEVLVRGEVVDGVLQGDLGVVGGGDPTISGRDYDGDSFGAFREWAARLRAVGIERVAGRLVLDHSLFDDERIHPDWPKDQLDRWYEAPVDALSLNDNCVLLKVRPNGRPGTPAAVEVIPPLSMFRVVADATTVHYRHKQWMSLGRRTGDESYVLTASGRIRTRTESIDRWITVTDPTRYFGEGLRAGLAEEGIGIDGPTVTSGKGDPDDGDWRRVYVHRTGLLPVLEILNKRSQNFYAESVLKLLGARLCGEGSWAGGRRVVAEFLAGLGIEPGSYSLHDGSGMSRGNRFSPREMTLLLRYMFHHRWGGEFVRTLPYSGEEDLKWDERLADPPYRGNVMAKTGYIDGVSTLSGYAKARSGKLYTFSILLNSIRRKSSAEAAQDRIVRAVVDHG